MHQSLHLSTHPSGSSVRGQAGWLAQLQQHRAIAVIRAGEASQGLGMAAAVAAGGMQLLEVTWNSDRPEWLINQLRQRLPHCTIGAGTLLTAADVERAIAAGAKFLFTPHTNPELIRVAVAAGVPMVAGALTPTEIVTAWQAGAACVKVFPIQTVGGVNYLKCIKTPLEGIPLIPTGGVTLENASEFLAAGAVAVGLAGQLFPSRAIALQDWAQITAQAAWLMESVRPYALAPHS
ncbi:bifunctional 4-hydroxy-2-oxoglutarate aldolase/2-dehydro-3-deoxy-phosphogluconate aldolase [Leptolyngbya sp. AN02str]|uniref:bifunctional 4-hydroxy-2-oxoglutarate aldolase/2-dehydro-3-deoxy-phosphogluconate aldolase n=1 Tax=Leptolyngbya sp. AN02str TaxID=3423363 RepID=UPI003D311741